MDLSAISWSSLLYTAEDISHHEMPVIVRQRITTTPQRKVGESSPIRAIGTK